MTDDAPGERIASVDELPHEGTFLFRVEPVDDDGGVEREAILLRDGIAGAEGDDGHADGEESDDGQVDGGENDDGPADGEDGVVAWLNYCQHFTHIKLDKGGGAPIRNGEILCTNHGAMFEADTGLCTHGPCEGAYLNPLEVRVEDGEVYLDDPEYVFVGLGPVEGKIGDLSSTSNVEF